MSIFMRFSTTVLVLLLCLDGLRAVRNGSEGFIFQPLVKGQNTRSGPSGCTHAAHRSGSGQRCPIPGFNGTGDAYHTHRFNPANDAFAHTDTYQRGRNMTFNVPNP